MDRPIIGITTSFNEGEQRLDHRYVLAIERANGLPVIVPMLESEAAALRFADMLDGLVVTGGPAVEIGLDGALPADISPTDPIRLTSDMRILRAFLDRRRPTLGICYGMQLCNALKGGQIFADVESQRPRSLVHSSRRGGTTHPIAIAPGSVLATILKTNRLEVNTRHVQAIKNAGEGLRIAATAPDGVIEAIETDDGAFIGVQFHPERMADGGMALFRDLVDRTRQR